MKHIKPYRFLYKRKQRKFSATRILSSVLILLGVLSVGIVVLPFLDWQLNYNQVLGSESVVIPLPKTKVINNSQFPNVLANSLVNLSGVDYTNAKNWFPEESYLKTKDVVPTYSLSIPRLNISKAIVSSTNDDLSRNLVHYGGSGTPGKPGNTVVFGHSTLPQLFNQRDYKTIFATLHNLKMGDEVVVEYDGVIYTYSIVGIRVVDPQDTSVLSQQYDDSYLTLITCTPPGTYWKRLIIKTKIKSIT